MKTSGKLIKGGMKRTPSLSYLRTALFAISILIALVSARADVIDNSLKVRFNFDAAPVDDVIVDSSPGGGHPGTNSFANWVDSEDGRSGVMSFDPNAPSQILLSPA